MTVEYDGPITDMRLVDVWIDGKGRIRTALEIERKAVHVIEVDDEE